MSQHTVIVEAPPCELPPGYRWGTILREADMRVNAVVIDPEGYEMVIVVGSLPELVGWVYRFDV